LTMRAASAQTVCPFPNLPLPALLLLGSPPGDVTGVALQERFLPLSRMWRWKLDRGNLGSVDIEHRITVREVWMVGPQAPPGDQQLGRQTGVRFNWAIPAETPCRRSASGFPGIIA